MYDDALLAKIVAHADTRNTALARARAALDHLVLLGVRTNASLLSSILSHPRMMAGQVDTAFLESEIDALVTDPAAGADAREPALALSAALALHERLEPGGHAGAGPRADAADHDHQDPWHTLGAWRLT